jgi:hypothetical protein
MLDFPCLPGQLHDVTHFAHIQQQFKNERKPLISRRIERVSILVGLSLYGTGKTSVKKVCQVNMSVDFFKGGGGSADWSGGAWVWCHCVSPPVDTSC